MESTKSTLSTISVRREIGSSSELNVPEESATSFILGREFLGSDYADVRALSEDTGSSHSETLHPARRLRWILTLGR